MSKSYKRLIPEYVKQQRLRDSEFLNEQRRKLNRDAIKYKQELEEYLKLKGELE